MIERVGETQEMRIQQYGLAEFLQEAQELIERGYVFDFDSNERYPQSIGHMFICTMVPKNSLKEVLNSTPAAAPEVPEEFKALQAVIEEGKKPRTKPKPTA